MPGKNPMTQEAASKIQSSQALNGRDMSSKGFAAHAQGAGARNENAARRQGQGGQGGGQGGNAGGQNQAYAKK